MMSVTDGSRLTSSTTFAKHFEFHYLVTVQLIFITLIMNLFHGLFQLHLSGNPLISMKSESILSIDPVGERFSLILLVLVTCF